METLVVPGTLDSLSQIREYVTFAAKLALLDGKAAYALCLAVNEIATNVVTHGLEDRHTDSDVRVSACMNEQSLTITLEDSGPSYDPDQLDVEGLELPLSQRAIGGLGVYLAKNNVDQFRYERVDDCNRHTFVVNRRPV